MKKFALSILALASFALTVGGGTETFSSKETRSLAPDCPQWYADTELNLGLSGVYAMTGNSWRDDLYLAVDHAWGGALDAKYFFRRYFGIGIQGTILSVNSHEIFDNGFTRVLADNDEGRHAMGSLLGTFTLRFPVNCSRFAPYVWAGGGGIFGGGRDHDFFLDPAQPLGVVRREFRTDDTRSMAQVGGGFEVRLHKHLGITTDFSWNIVSGANNNFGMARTGVNFAF